jgi:hypothetical protein
MPLLRLVGPFSAASELVSLAAHLLPNSLFFSCLRYFVAGVRSGRFSPVCRIEVGVVVVA